MRGGGGEDGDWSKQGARRFTRGAAGSCVVGGTAPGCDVSIPSLRRFGRVDSRFQEVRVRGWRRSGCVDSRF